MDYAESTITTRGAPGRLLRWTRAALNIAEAGLAPLLDLAIRVLVASVFFQSGLSKIASWFDDALAL